MFYSRKTDLLAWRPSTPQGKSEGEGEMKEASGPKDLLAKLFLPLVPKGKNLLLLPSSSAALTSMDTAAKRKRRVERMVRKFFFQSGRRGKVLD